MGLVRSTQSVHSQYMASASGLSAGSRGQSSTAPYVGDNPHSNSLFAQPRPVNQTLGWMTNETIPYHWTVARWTNNLDQNIMNGQIVFLKCDDGTPLLRNRAYTMLNLPMCNYALYRDALASHKSDAVSNTTTSSIKSLESILKKYRPMGSVINDMNGDSDPSNNADRVINV